jgi:hydrogenase nickel incorporation protein HypB
MCTTCGCSDQSRPTLTDLQGNETAIVSDEHGHSHRHPDSSDHSHHHDHDSGPAHSHDHDHSVRPIHAHEHAATRHATTLRLEQQILAKNDRLAERNRGWFAGRNILAVNLVSSPGAGKTTLLERTIRDLGRELHLAVIEGDQATDIDARRIRDAGCHVVQINTGTGCHLDAEMVAHGLQNLDPPMNSVVLIENVGNLVCPALFDLGERAKVVVCSVTDGDDKPIKYPHMFRASEVMILNKIDLLPYVQFDLDRCVDYARQVNPALRILQVSATRGDGLTDWYEWLREQRAILLGKASSCLTTAPNLATISGVS